LHGGLPAGPSGCRAPPKPNKKANIATGKYILPNESKRSVARRVKTSFGEGCVYRPELALAWKAVPKKTVPRKTVPKKTVPEKVDEEES
jgi:hypothetical protein